MPTVHRLASTPEEAMNIDVGALRREFLRLLTTDSETKDRRRREFNQAIFNGDEGWAIWSSTDLDMVMDKFDKAARLVPAGDEGRLREAARAMWYAHTEDERFAGPVSDDPYGDFEKALLAATPEPVANPWAGETPDDFPAEDEGLSIGDLPVVHRNADGDVLAVGPDTLRDHLRVPAEDAPSTYTEVERLDHLGNRADGVRGPAEDDGRLREALEQIVKVGHRYDAGDRVREIARAALAATPEPWTDPKG